MSLSTEQEGRLRTLMEIFLEENTKINLSAYRTEEQCWVGNVLDSVAVEKMIEGCASRCPARHAEEAGALRQSSVQAPRRPSRSTECRAPQRDVNIIDIGTGGGFPLLPLAILFPDTKFTGLDATRKKIEAVRRICDAMELTNVDLVAGRAEELGHDPDLREQFDVVLSRAIAPLAELLEYMSPFARPTGSSGRARVGGNLLCWKSMHIEDELTESVEARMKLNVRLVEKQEYELPGDWGKRQILVFEKMRELSDEFPRGVGEAKRGPL